MKVQIHLKKTEIQPRDMHSAQGSLTHSTLTPQSSQS